MCRKVLATLVVLLLLSASAVVVAEDYVWTGSGDGVSWDGTGNWTGGSFDYPDSYTDNAFIAGAGLTSVIDATTGDFGGEIRGGNVYVSHSDLAPSGGTLTIDTGATLDLSSKLLIGGDGVVADSNDGVVNISGTLSGQDIKTYGSGHVINLNGGTIDLSGYFWMGNDGNPNSVTTINMSSGTIDAAALSLGRVANSGTHYLNMSGGTINLVGNIDAPAAAGTAHIQFDGGTMNVGNKIWLNNNTTMHSTMDMTGDATLIIGYDMSSSVASWIASGILTADGGSGYLEVDYGVRNAGKTTVTVTNSVPAPAGYLWTGLGDGSSWDDAGNWEAGAYDYPDSYTENANIGGPTATAVIDATTGDYNGEIRGNNVIVGHTYFAPSGGTLNLETGGTLDLNGKLFFGGDGAADDANDGVVNINGGTLTGSYIWSYGSGHQLNLNSGTITLTDRVEMGNDGNPNSVSTINITGGTLNAAHLELVNVADSGTHNLNMTGGTVNLVSNLSIPAAYGTAHVQFDGGTINVGNKLWLNNNTVYHGTMDMSGDATLIIGIDWTTNINLWIAGGRLTADGGAGYFEVDYGVRNPGKTTVTVSYDVPVPAGYLWTGLGDGSSWDDGDNWEEGDYDYPDSYTENAAIGGAGATAVIDATTGDFGGEIRSNNVIVGHAFYDSNGGALNIETGGTLALNGNLNLGGDGLADGANDAVVNINGGTLNGSYIRTFGSGHQVNLNGGTIDLTGRIDMGYDGNSVGSATINMTSGTINAGYFELGRNENSGTHTLNMSGGSINLASRMDVCASAGNVCHVDFDGGTIEMGGKLWLNKTSTFDGSMDMSGDAMLIIGLDWESGIEGFIDNGTLTSYDGEGTFVVDFDDRNAGKTTVTAVAPCYIKGDISGDCTVDTNDLRMLAENWLAGADTVVAVTPDDNYLRALYAFDDGSGIAVADTSGNGFNAAIIQLGDGAWDSTGGFDGGGCLDFNSTEVDADANMFNTLDDEISFAMWINIDVNALDGTSGTNFVTYILGSTGSASSATQIGRQYGDADEVDATFRIGFDPLVSPASDLATHTSLMSVTDDIINGWHHYGFTQNTTTGAVRIYIDGLLVGQNDDRFKPLDDIRDLATVMNIGYYFYNGGEGGHFNGKIDEFRVYDYELSQAEIVSLAGLQQLTQPLVAESQEIDTELKADGSINFLDFAVMADNWLQSGN